MSNHVYRGGAMSEPTIEVYEVEDRTFPPSDAFKASALTSDSSLYDEANADFEAFWARQARELITWQKPFTKVLEWDLPFAKWFSDGQLNMSENCLDRHVEAGKGDKVAYHWEGEPGDTRTVTYAELLTEVKKFANVLKGLGLEKGDRGRDLHAHDSRTSDCDACVQSYRRGSLGHLRWL